LLAITDGLNEQLAQRPSFELESTEHVEDLPTQGLAGLLQFLK
jgi:hypothetical protein